MRQKLLMCANEVTGGTGQTAQHVPSLPSAPSLASEPSAPPMASQPSAPPASQLELEKSKLGENGTPAATAAAAPSAPSAPPVETFKSTECVVCLEKKVRSSSSFAIYDFLRLPPCFSATSSFFPAATCAAAGTVRAESERVRFVGQIFPRKSDFIKRQRQTDKVVKQTKNSSCNINKSCSVNDLGPLCSEIRLCQKNSNIFQSEVQKDVMCYQVISLSRV